MYFSPEARWIMVIILIVTVVIFTLIIFSTEANIKKLVIVGMVWGFIWVIFGLILGLLRKNI